MKLAGRDASRFLAKPAGAAAILLHGSDPMRVALKRQALVLTLVGKEGAAEMRLSRLAAADLRRDPAALLDAVKATGFFPGPRAVLVEEAGDGIAPLLASALTDWRDGDAVVVVTAGRSARRALCARSSRPSDQPLRSPSTTIPPAATTSSQLFPPRASRRLLLRRWRIWRRSPAVSTPATLPSSSRSLPSTNMETRRRCPRRISPPSRHRRPRPNSTG